MFSRLATITGFEVAPVAPSVRFDWTRSGSIESSQILVPEVINDSKGETVDDDELDIEILVKVAVNL